MVLGWQAAYAPSEVEKQKCYDAAEHGGHKSEECKSLWEKATTDPVAFFTLWLVIFTGGLTVSTVLLWRAGEKQFGLLSENAAEQSRQMEASSAATAEAAKRTLESDRAWLTWKYYTAANLINTTMSGKYHRHSFGFAAGWENTGRSPAQQVRTINMVKVIDLNSDIPFFEPTSEDLITTDTARGVGDKISGILLAIGDTDTADVVAGRKKVIFFSRVTYVDVFNPEIERISETCFDIRHGGPNATAREDDKPTSPFNARSVGSQNRVT